MKAYLDSSFLVSLYANDVHSTAATSEARKLKGQTLLVSTLAELEFANALELHVFRKQFTRKQIDMAHAGFEEDVQKGVFDVIDLDPATFVQARKLVMQTTAAIGCRTADILHVGAALEANVDKFFSFDNRQKIVAQRAKLKTN